MEFELVFISCLIFQMLETEKRGEEKKERIDAI